MTTKVTKRAMFEAMRSYFEGSDILIEVGETCINEGTLIEFCDKEIAALDRKAVKAKETAAAKKSASDELTETIFSVLTDDFMTIANVASLVEGDEVTVARCQYRLNKLVEAGRAEKEEMVITSDSGKKRKVMGFRLKTE